jgi:hypothetical protein
MRQRSTFISVLRLYQTTTITLLYVLGIFMLYEISGTDVEILLVLRGSRNITVSVMKYNVA